MAPPKHLGGLVTPIAARLAGRQRMGLANVAVHWVDILGPDLAERCQIDKFVPQGRGVREGGTLTLRVAAADALEIQHAATLIMERINTYLGYQAVGRVRLVHGRIAGQRKPAQRPRPLTADEEADVAALVADVASPGMRTVLETLGKAIYRADPGPDATGAASPHTQDRSARPPAGHGDGRQTR